MRIRKERGGDEDAIGLLTAAAFNGVEHSSGGEAQIVARLRLSGALALSFVAEEAGILVGHVAFSPVRVASGDPGWFGLGPVSVDIDSQRRGLGSALIRAGLTELSADGARGCFVLGDPVYYERFGFRHDSRLTYASTGSYFQVLTFGSEPPTGEVTYDPAFG